MRSFALRVVERTARLTVVFAMPTRASLGFYLNHEVRCDLWPKIRMGQEHTWHNWQFSLYELEILQVIVFGKGSTLK